VTEMQAGGGIFGDLTYRRWGGETECGLFVLATVSSCPDPGRAIVDAGRKAMNVDMMVPQLVGNPGAALSHVSAEHGVLHVDPGSPPLEVGEKVNFIVGYEDWTVFLHDRLVGVRDGKVETVWDILGRGKLS
jgi:D-serine deaminase-like pyridoxal phosphate-dependent protein